MTVLNRDVIQIIDSFLENKMEKINTLIHSIRLKHQISKLLNQPYIPYPDKTVAREFFKIEHIFFMLYIQIDPASKATAHCSKISPIYWRGRFHVVRNHGCF